MASSDSVTSTGVPKIVVVLRKRRTSRPWRNSKGTATRSRVALTAANWRAAGHPVSGDFDRARKASPSDDHRRRQDENPTRASLHFELEGPNSLLRTGGGSEVEWVAGVPDSFGDLQRCIGSAQSYYLILLAQAAGMPGETPERNAIAAPVQNQADCPIRCLRCLRAGSASASRPGP